MESIAKLLQEAVAVSAACAAAGGAWATHKPRPAPLALAAAGPNFASLPHCPPPHPRRPSTPRRPCPRASATTCRRTWTPSRPPPPTCTMRTRSPTPARSKLRAPRACVCVSRWVRDGAGGVHMPAALSVRRGSRRRRAAGARERTAGRRGRRPMSAQHTLLTKATFRLQNMQDKDAARCEAHCGPQPTWGWGGTGGNQHTRQPAIVPVRDPACRACCSCSL
jgi:hypothetical protein